jgi:hypothetical protein
MLARQSLVLRGDRKMPAWALLVWLAIGAFAGLLARRVVRRAAIYLLVTIGNRLQAPGRLEQEEPHV